MSIDWTDVQGAIRAWVMSGTGLDTAHVIWRDQDGARPSSPYASIKMDVEKIGQDWTRVEDVHLATGDKDITLVDVGESLFTSPVHGLLTGDGPMVLSSADTLPSPFLAGQLVYVIRINDDEFQLAETVGDAHEGVEIELDDAGVGALTLLETDDTARSGQEILVFGEGVRRLPVSIQLYASPVVGSTSAKAHLERLISRSKFQSMQSLLSVGGVSLVNFGRVLTLSDVINQTRQDPRASLDITMRVMSVESEAATFIQYADPWITSYPFTPPDEDEGGDDGMTQAFLWTVPTTGAQWTVNIPVDKAMPSANYAIVGAIENDLDAPIPVEFIFPPSGRTLLTFAFETEGDLTAGQTVNFILRSRD